MKKPVAVFTIVKNEKYFMPIWYKYYTRYFPKEDIYILDHQTTDGSLLNIDCNIIPVSHDKAFDAIWLMNTVNNFQKELLKKYEYVIFAEADEILITLENPNHDLRQHVEDMKLNGKNFDVAFSWQLQHNNIYEGDYDPTIPILQQRRTWAREMAFDKTLISAVPLDWDIGFHDTKYRRQQDYFDGKNKIHPNKNLILLHLHHLDYQIFMKRKLNFSNYNLADQLHPGDAFQQRLKTKKELRDFFHQYEDLLVEIPHDFPIVI